MLVAGICIPYTLSFCATKPTRHLGEPLPRADLVDMARSAALRHGVEDALVLGVIHVESRFQPDAESRVGARGLMQLMPRTADSLAKRLGWRSYQIDDPAFNLDAGTAYLAYLLKTFDGDREWSLAAYNTGPGRVKRWRRKGKRLPKYSKRYVAAVLKARDRFLQNPNSVIKDLDQRGLRNLIRNRLFGPRADESIGPHNP